MNHQHHMSHSGMKDSDTGSHVAHGHVHPHSGHVHPTEHAHHMNHTIHLNDVSHADSMDDANNMNVFQSSLLDNINHTSHEDHHTHNSSNTYHVNDSGHVDHVANMHQMDHSGHSKSFGSFTDSDFLFEGINITSIKELILAMLVAMVIAVLYEALNTMQHVREHKLAKQRHSQARSLLILRHGISSIIRLTTVSFSYLMMLCVMTMNVWLFLSIILGAGLGHLLIRPLLAKKIHVDTEVTGTLSDHVLEKDVIELNTVTGKSGQRNQGVKVEEETQLLTTV